ncbi:variable surface lipoprotein [Mycoplasma bovis]|nr:variable surface lipoprotein [Mycoplasmopsis bovis]MBT1396471.1 variable surface lipoprotein [Mycoplasmopsis bovis]MBT1397510.1 variable surface lipoprotein [Mycoplasmopsis bovis]MBT1404032.1 variable surface lipoprotein [Mycoplasmopsis bovis]
MKMNRKILFSLSAISSVATVPLLAAKCGNTQGLDKAIKTLNLGEINVYEDLKLDTPGEKHILNALAKANDTKEVKIDLSQLEAKDIKSTGAVIIEAKKDSKLYSGRIQVTFTSKKVKRVDISTVKKENLGGISNYTGVKEMATILRKEFSLPNLSEKDITITLDSAATNDKEGKLIVISNPDSEHIFGKFEIVLPKLAPLGNNVKLVSEYITKFKAQAKKMEDNSKNITKWEASEESKKQDFEKIATGIKEVAAKLKDKYTKTAEKLEQAIKGKNDIDNDEFNNLNIDISLVSVAYDSTVKHKTNGKVTTDYTEIMDELKKVAKSKDGSKEAEILIDFSN